MTDPLQRENLSCLQASNKREIIINIIPLHWCHDERPHSGTALYTEWISAQLPIWRLPNVDPSHPQGNPQENAQHALHYLCLVSEPTILYFYANVSSLQP